MVAHGVESGWLLLMSLRLGLLIVFELHLGVLQLSSKDTFLFGLEHLVPLQLTLLFDETLAGNFFLVVLAFINLLIELLLFELFQEHPMLEQDPIGLSLALNFWQQPSRWCPSQWLFDVNLGLEGHRTAAISPFVDTNFIWAVAQHDSLVVSNACLLPGITYGSNS